jgi:hypothetical protein
MIFIKSNWKKDSNIQFLKNIKKREYWKTDHLGGQTKEATWKVAVKNGHRYKLRAKDSILWGQHYVSW